MAEETASSVNEKIRLAIASYKQNFDRVNKEERYKWEAAGWYKRHWNIDAQNFASMLAAAFEKTANLLTSRNYWPYRMAKEFAQTSPETVRSLFRTLYDENIPLAERYGAFCTGFDGYVKPLGKRHFQDLHAVSVYLSFEYPEKYFIYKYGIYKNFRDRIGYADGVPEHKSKIWEFESHMRMCNIILDEIHKDSVLIELSSSRLDGSCEKDEAMHMLAFDIAYYGAVQMNNGDFAGTRNEETESNAYWPSLDEYNPGITVEMWTDVLNDRSVTTFENLDMLKKMLDLGGESTCAHLSELYGKEHSYYNRLGTGFGEKVKKRLNCPDCMEYGRIRYYPIPFLGRDVRENGQKRYSWKLRDELKEALMNFEFPNGEEQHLNAEVHTNDIGLNTILYGPPGTGKTYHTVIYAVAVIENKTLAEVESENYANVLERYAAYKSQGLIAFTTFHQSYGYEEFVEGIKPAVLSEDDSDEDSSDIQYRIEPGIFKKFCEKAETSDLSQPGAKIHINDSPNIWKVSLEGAGENPTRSECFEKGHIRIGWDGYGSEITDETDFSAGGRKPLNAFINRMRIGDIVLSCYSASVIDAIGVVTGEYEWHDEYPKFKRLRKVDWVIKNIREDISDINGGKSMTLSSVYRMPNVELPDVLQIIKKHNPQTFSASNKRSGNYVFIIDEINRGNISKIFGELITLIEPSRRIGAEEETQVVLPYSQKLFGVPDNVYIIGTMNTADRSIAALDTALRRRFRFREMLPNTTLLKGICVDGIFIDEMLSRMNRRISVLYDREHTLGHAYFMPLKKSPTLAALAEIFSNNVIPLLQEYFCDDYEKIRLVLGDNQKSSTVEQFIVAKLNDNTELFGDANVGLDEGYSYEINEAAFDNIEAYRGI